MRWLSDVLPTVYINDLFKLTDDSDTFTHIFTILLILIEYNILYFITLIVYNVNK
jgi:hypothetical protein